MVDLVIKGGKVVSHDGIFEAAIAINGGQVAAIADASALPPAKRTIDVSGKYVLPGLVDGHVHIPGASNSFESDCLSETRAAAAGGVTSIGIHIIDPDRKPGILQYAEYCRKSFEESSVVDAFFHAQILNEQGLEEIPKCPGIGITSFKATWGEVPGGEGQMFRCLEQISKLGPRARAIIHAENLDVVAVLRERLIKQGRKDFPAWNESRPGFCEAEYMIRSIFWGKLLNCPLYFEHMTIGQGVDIALKAKTEGVDMVVETCPQYLTHSSQDKGIFSDNPALGRVNPPLRDKESNEKLWQGIKRGVIDCIGSDHAPHALKDKGDDLWKAPSGLGNLTEMILPVMVSEGVHKGRISLEKVVDLCCLTPAKIWGLYPRKGTISVGSDADMVVIDLEKKVKVSWKMLHSVCEWSIYEGWEFQGWPILTILRGEIIAEHGNVIARPGFGKYLPRQV